MAASTHSVIQFYRQGDPYGFLSNFWPSPISVKGKIWPTTEHYFQAMKFEGTEFEEKVRLETSASDAARTGRRRDLPLREDWEQVKDDFMREALFAKFTQHADLRKQLLETGEAKLVEHTSNDSYWADGGDGTGKNMLGILLMELRNKLGNEIGK